MADHLLGLTLDNIDRLCYLSSMKPTKQQHEITKMVMGKGRMHHGGSTHTAGHKCPVCSRVRWFNMNWLGHGGAIYCNGLKTAVMFRGSMNNWDIEALFEPTPKQLAKAAAKAEQLKGCTPGHEDHCQLATDPDCNCNCGGANHGARKPRLIPDDVGSWANSPMTPGHPGQTA